MFRVDAASVVRWRTVAVWVIRAAAIAMAVLGSYTALRRLLQSIGQGSLDYALNVWDSSAPENSFYRGVAMVAVAAALGVAAPWLARWAIALPPEGCPRCGHDGGAGRSGRCSECGLLLDSPAEPPG